jgi:hypothetical protein
MSAAPRCSPRPIGSEERAKTQAANEFITFGVVACASFASGGVMARLGWAAISYATIAPLLVAAAATLWYAAISSRPAALTVPPAP